MIVRNRLRQLIQSSMDENKHNEQGMVTLRSILRAAAIAGNAKFHIEV
jgi:hypothetical protein